MTRLTIEEARRFGLLPAAVAAKYMTKKKPGSERTKLEDAFMRAWIPLSNGMPKSILQFRFDPVRRWRFDFAWPAAKLAVEIQGGTWIKGRHTSGSSRESEYEKMNAAQRLGWCVLQYGTERMKDPASVAAEVAEILKQRLQKGQ